MLICGSEHTLKQLSDTRPSRSAFGVKEAIPHFTWSPWVFRVCVCVLQLIELKISVALLDFELTPGAYTLIHSADI